MMYKMREYYEYTVLLINVPKMAPVGSLTSF